jgi:hypothetical protein
MNFFCLEKDEEEEAELAAEVSEDSLGSLWDDEDSKVRGIKFRCTDPNMTFHLVRFQIRLPVVRWIFLFLCGTVSLFLMSK